MSVGSEDLEHVGEVRFEIRGRLEGIFGIFGWGNIFVNVATARAHLRVWFFVNVATTRASMRLVFNLCIFECSYAGGCWLLQVFEIHHPYSIECNGASGAKRREVTVNGIEEG